MFEYSAIVTAVYDGDTITADIDLGFYSWRKNERFRMFGIDAPEVRGKERPDGLKTRDWLRTRILGKKVLLKSIKDKKGKYGRWLATIIDDEGDVIEDMIELGLAERKEY